MKIICVGKLKEEFYTKAQAEYTKMLARFCDIVIDELPDEPLTNVKGEKALSAVRDAEGRRILAKCEGYVIACDVRAKQLSSEAFAQKLDTLMTGGNSTISFVIGGSLGLSEEVKSRADMRLSVSEMTMPHRLFRIVLLEQVFRAFKILNHETYHK
ncbi:23S rRNA (pseudouridine(1915)-N(3))-methyltransferase RlmH [Christensenella timonensis]|uniref:23S rRNA (pseudouridine(1915)-N(3))-methyltransferase RlmH n=1 Tax=Christensenella timonensis TaxID=1816678 RepID=UPI00241EF04F|nr:23S rRNA (pseudouridine(1915)-N(3))-methyltransferase RlmH [Christensenella timonensis]